MKQRTNKKAKKNRKRRNQASWRQSARQWMAASTMSALLAVSSQPAPLPPGGLPPGVWDAIYTITRTQQTQRFDIPPGPLETVLASFQNLTSICVLVSDDKLRTIPSLGVAGVYTTDQALAQLLRGTGAGYRFNCPKLVTLELHGLAVSVEILGGISPSSPKYTEPLRDTPQTITLIPKSVTEEQGATTLRDVLRNVTGLTMTSGFPPRAAWCALRTARSARA